MPSAIPNSRADTEAAASIWTAILTPWRRAADLSEILGVHRSLLSHYASGSRSAGWATLRGALRATARRHPEGVPALVQSLARELLDVEGTWVPDVGPGELAGIDAEAGDVTVAVGRLLSAARSGASAEEIETCARELVREAHEAAAAARAR